MQHYLHFATISFACVLHFITAAAQGQDITISDDRVINDLTYASNYLFIADGDDGHTRVDVVAGARVGQLNVTQNSSLYFLGGRTDLDVSALDNAYLLVDGGHVGDDLRAYGNAIVDVRSGNITGGAIVASEYGTINIRGGLIENVFVAEHAGIINVYGPDLFIVGDDPPFLRGTLLDGTPIDVQLDILDQGQVNLNIVPEPSTLALAAIGACVLMVRRRRRLCIRGC